MMQIYDCPFGSTGGTAETVAIDAVELTPGDDRPLLILSYEIYNVSDFGDAQAEIIPMYWIRGNTTSGSGGVAAAAPNAAIPSGPTAAMTYEAMNTTVASVGTTKQLKSVGFNVQAGMLRILIPEERIMATQANTLMCWRQGAAPADSLTQIGNVCLGEVG